MDDLQSKLELVKKGKKLLFKTFAHHPPTPQSRQDFYRSLRLYDALEQYFINHHTPEVSHD